jgi:acetolactate decarboxylase
MTHKRSCDADTLYQVSTISALLKGDYDGSVSFGELKTHGDFGLGTFQSLDGEMIAFDGRFYQVTADGKVQAVSDEKTTPFAAVTWFEPDLVLHLEAMKNGGSSNPADATISLDELRVYLDSQIPSANLFYAVRIDADFSYVKTRSVPSQKKPYPPLAEVAATQPTFEFHSVRGTIVGLRCPDYVQGVNVPGWHFHFITADRTGGGHLLEARLNRQSKEKSFIQIDQTDEFQMTLPQREDFYRLNLSEKTSSVLKKVE